MLTLFESRHTLGETIQPAREDWKAVKIGHGPATVIGCVNEPKVRNVPVLVEADTLRERGCGDEPRSIREAFLLFVGGMDCDCVNHERCDFLPQWHFGRPPCAARNPMTIPPRKRPLNELSSTKRGGA